MRHQNYKSITFVLLLFSTSLVAQTNSSSFRPAVEFSMKLNKKIELQLEEELRLAGFSSFDRTMTTLGGSYALNKSFKAGGEYTWIYLNNLKDGYYESRHRFAAWLQASQKVNRFKFTLREKFQNTYRDEDLGNYSYNPKMVLRSKLELSYNIRKAALTPYVSAEMQYQLNNPYGNVVNKWRYTAGATYNFTKKMGLELYYKFDREVNVTTPLECNVLGAVLKYRFK